MRTAATLALLLIVAACAEEPAPPPIVPVRAAAEQHGLRLQLESARSIVRTNEDIEVTASVVNERGEVATLWSASVNGPVAFGVTRLEDGLATEIDWTDDGIAYELPADEPVNYPFSKFLVAVREGPDADFLRAYTSDPELHLPPGRWRIEAVLHGVLGERDGPQVEIMVSAAVEVLVTK